MIGEILYAMSCKTNVQYNSSVVGVTGSDEVVRYEEVYNPWRIGYEAWRIDKV